MLTVKGVHKLQTDYSVAEGRFFGDEIAFGEYLNQCRVYVRKNLPANYSEWESKKKKEHLKSIVSDFTSRHKVKVTGYVTKEGVIESDILLENLIDAVTGYSVLKEALEDPEVDEIQINDKYTIFVSKGGVLVPYVNKRGKPMQFTEDEDIRMVLNLLVNDGTGNTPQFTSGKPIMNEKTAEHQYRINAVHPVANTRDKAPNNWEITTVTLRKFKEVKLMIEDLVRTGACTEKMGRLMLLLGQADLKLFCVGPTGSGKTTLLNIIAGTNPKDKRMILIQNPAEITFFERDKYNRNIRNVVHWEVCDAVNMAGFITNSLRATPEVILLGEMREEDEFFQANRAMRTGHKVLGTFHAEGAEDGVGRFATEIGSVNSGNSYVENIRLVAGVIDIIIAQYKYPDGRRRITEITEILGADEHGNIEANCLFKFELSGKVRVNSSGLKEVLGEFKQLGVMSKRLQEAMFKAAIDIDTIQEFVDEAMKEN